MVKVGVIGAGFSSLSSACFLAKEGFEVHVFEKHDKVGGRCRKFEAQGFVFDMGPSWYWMPEVFEQFFNAFGKKVADYYELVRLDPSYKVFFPTSEVEIPSTVKALKELFEQWEPGAGERLEVFLKEAAFKYELGINKIVHKPGLSVFEFLDKEVILGALKMHVFTSFDAYTRKYFSDKRILQLLEFPILFLGATAKTTPALYSLMNYADMQLGTWYPKKGMHEIVNGMKQLAEELGVKFHFNANVDAITVENGAVTGVDYNNGEHQNLDKLIAGADYQFVESKLLPKEYRNYSDDYWQKRKLAPSSLLFYLGVNKKVAGLEHHNLFFDEEFELHSKEIYDTPQWPTKPLFYVCVPSKTDDTVAPQGSENMFVLMPLATGIEDNETIREKYYHLLLSRIEKRTGVSIREHVVYKRSYAINDFVADYNAFKGNAYGLANTLDQTAILKPSIINKKVKGLFYTGQLTVPGPGVPPSIISGEIVAKELMKSL